MSEPKVKNGGPAFPQHPGIDIDHGDTRWLGMSLRDYFAGQALAGLCVNYPQGAPEGWAESLSKAAYVYADAMLKARETART